MIVYRSSCYLKVYLINPDGVTYDFSLFNRFLKGTLPAWSIAQCTRFITDLSRYITPSFHHISNLRCLFPLYQVVFIDIDESEIHALQC